MKYYHVDVFSQKPLSGNGLAVVFPPAVITKEIMQKITREFRQFETIFIFPETEEVYPVRIFTVEEELEFAGHPLIGAAAVIHSLNSPSPENIIIRLKTGERIISLKSRKSSEIFSIEMNQGKASFLYKLNNDEKRIIAEAVNLSKENIHPEYPAEVISTGLPYLLLPVKSCIEKAKITVPNFENILNTYGAKFIYIFDPETLECRTWDNYGIVEDVATGSAAGPLCAYLTANGFHPYEKPVKINQGKFTGRESVMIGRVDKNTENVFISGDVAFFAEGEIYA